MSRRFVECSVLNTFIYNFGNYNVNSALYFINIAKEMTPPDVSNQIMFGLKNNMYTKKLIQLAKAIGNKFTTDASVVKSNYWAKILVDEGVPITAFKGYDQHEIMNTQTKSVITCEPLICLKERRFTKFVNACRGDYSAMPIYKNKYPMKYLSWAALFGDALTFAIIYKKEDVDERTVKMAIKGGSKFIINRIMDDFDLTGYMFKLIKHHRNDAVIRLTKEYSLQQFAPYYKNIAIRYMNHRISSFFNH